MRMDELDATLIAHMAAVLESGDRARGVNESSPVGYTDRALELWRFAAERVAEMQREGAPDIADDDLPF